MFWVLAPLAVALLFYYFLLKPQLYWRSKNVKQGPPIPILGDNFKFFFRQESRMEMGERLYNRFKDARYVGIYQTTLPTLMLRDPNLIKQITVKNFEYFLNRRSFISENTNPIFSKNLIFLKGDSWKEMRATLSPTFTASKMRAMFTLMEKSAQQYVDFYLKQNKDVIELELKDSFTRFANDVIANCAFGITVDSLKEPENEFYMNGKDITNSSGFWNSFMFLIDLMAPKIGSFFKLSRIAPEFEDFFKSLIQSTVKVREEQNIVRPDMINLLMEARKGRFRYEESTEQKDAGFAPVEELFVVKTAHVRKFEMTSEMTDCEMAAQVFVFFFAGFDTISTMISFLCYELAVHPDIQERLGQEIDSISEANNAKLTYDVLNKMKYMDMVISESLRKHPPLDVANRVCTKPYTIQPERPGESPVHLQPGDVIWLPIFGIQHDEEYFPNPDKFDPGRFSDENKGNIKPYTYIPFGSGPRNCIASRFALMEVKTLLFHILAKYELTVIEKTTIPLKISRNNLNPAIEDGFWVGMKRRENP